MLWEITGMESYSGSDASMYSNSSSIVSPIKEEDRIGRVSGGWGGAGCCAWP